MMMTTTTGEDDKMNDGSDEFIALVRVSS